MKKDRKIFVAAYVLLSFCLEFSFLIIVFSTISIASILEFTVTGLVLNAGILARYLAFSLVFAANLYLCYAKLQKRYKEIKGFILKYLRITNHQHGSGYHSNNAVLVCMRQSFPHGKWNFCYISRYELDSNVFIRRLVFDNFFPKFLHFFGGFHHCCVFEWDCSSAVFRIDSKPTRNRNCCEKIDVMNESCTNLDMGERSQRNDD